jgi:small subunit ribosomal protein S11
MADDTAKVDQPIEKTSSPIVVSQKSKKKKRKIRRNVSHGQVHILASFNNTIVSVTDNRGNVLTSASAGSSGFKGSKKGTAYAAQIAAEKALTDAKQSFGVNKVDVFVKGIGLGRDSAVRTLVNQNISIESIRDVTPVPHGGVRPRRPKRA